PPAARRPGDDRYGAGFEGGSEGGPHLRAFPAACGPPVNSGAFSRYTTASYPRSLNSRFWADSSVRPVFGSALTCWCTVLCGTYSRSPAAKSQRLGSLAILAI